MWEIDMYTKICSMTEVLGRGDEGYRWDQEQEDVTSLERDKFKVSHWNTGIMMQILNYTPSSYICIHTYVQKDICGEVLNAVIQVAFCFQVMCLSRVQYPPGESTFSLIHTKATMYVLTVVLIFTVSIFPYHQQCYHLNAHR